MEPVSVAGWTLKCDCEVITSSAACLLIWIYSLRIMVKLCKYPPSFSQLLQLLNKWWAGIWAWSVWSIYITTVVWRRVKIQLLRTTLCKAISSLWNKNSSWFYFFIFSLFFVLMRPPLISNLRVFHRLWIQTQLCKQPHQNLLGRLLCWIHISNSVAVH